MNYILGCKLHISYEGAALSEVSKMAGVLFEDIFNVKDIDPEGKKFDRGKSETHFKLLSIYGHCWEEIRSVVAEFLSVRKTTFR